MAVALQRKWNDAKAYESLLDRSSRASIDFIASGSPTDTESEVRDALILLSPPTFGTLVRENVEVLALVYDAPDGKIWDTTVNYAHPDQKEAPKPTNEEQVVFEIRGSGGQTTQRTYSEALVEEQFANAAYQFATTDVERIIGLKAAGADNGVSLNATGVPFKEGQVQVIMHLWKSNATVSSGYLLDICDAMERQVINSGPFKMFPGGALQFTDFSAQQKAGSSTITLEGGEITRPYDAGWDFSFSFLWGRKTTVSIPGLPAFTAQKQPHEYLDILFMPEVIPVKNVVVSKPVRAAIHKLYDSENYYTLFGVPT